MVDDQDVRRLHDFAERGGHLVLTCRTGLMDRTGQLFEGKWGQPILDLYGYADKFAAFGWDPDAIPDPQDPGTFAMAKLDWAEREREPHAAAGLVSRVHFRKPRGKPMPEPRARANAARSRERAGVEHVFADQSVDDARLPHV